MKKNLITLMLLLNIMLIYGTAMAVLPYIKANNSDGTVEISTSDAISVTISLNAEGSSSEADWWLVAKTPASNWYYYNASGGAWSSGAWASGFAVSFQGALGDLSSTQVLNASSLPAGTYTLYFGIDTVVNGDLDAGAGQLYYDSVVINVLNEATLTGTVSAFTAALKIEKKSLFARIKDFLFSVAHAATSGVTVSVGDQSTTTDSSGNFTINNIPTGDQTVIFTQDSTSATYSLNDVDAGETFTLNDINVSSDHVATEHTGTWTGTIEFTDGSGSMTITIGSNGNSLSGTMILTSEDETGTFSGTETGTSLDATYTTSGGDCIYSGPLTGTFSGNTLNGNAPVTSASCGLEPEDSDSDSHPFTLTKS